MWYQRLSARSMPAAIVPRVGTIQPAASAAHATTAITLAGPQEGGAGGAGAGGRARPTPSFRATTPAVIPTTTTPPSTAPSSNPPKVPSASETQISPATASTDSASRAGAPDQPGNSSARTR